MTVAVRATLLCCRRVRIPHCWRVPPAAGSTAAASWQASTARGRCGRRRLCERQPPLTAAGPNSGGGIIAKANIASIELVLFMSVITFCWS